MTKRDQTLALHCEHIIPTARDHYYFFPDDTEAGYLCDDCARDLGFCPVCCYFVLGSNEDRTLGYHGCCTECLEELKIELGEYDNDDGDDFDYWPD